MSEETTSDAAAEPAEAEAAPEEKQPTPPIELNLPPEVAEGLTTVMTALETFGKTVQPFLDQSHANAMDAANAADPLVMPEGMEKVEQTIAEWGKKVDGQVEPLKAYIARIEKERVPVDEYLAKLKEVFKDAQPLPKPEEPAAS